jgi:ABC-type lipoprotein release transport system permease subunit
MLRSELYGVSAGDPWTLIMGTLLMAMVALVSALVPARRAASIDPMQALRSD